MSKSGDGCGEDERKREYGDAGEMHYERVKQYEVDRPLQTNVLGSKKEQKRQQLSDETKKKSWI